MNSRDLQPDLNDKLIEYLNEVLSAENAAEDRILSRIEECIVPAARDQLKHHLEETRKQQTRLREIIVRKEGSPTDAKADLPTMRLPAGMMMKKAITDMSKSIKSSGDTNLMKEEMELMKTKEDFGIENVEITSYRMLILACQKLGAQDAIGPLEQSLKEEQDMANWISTNLPITFDYLWTRIEAAIAGTDKVGTGTRVGAPS